MSFKSPDSVSSGSLNQPIGVATARWFEMLAEDADIPINPQSPLHLRSNENPHYLPEFDNESQHLPNTLVFHGSSRYTPVNALTTPERLQITQASPSQLDPWRSTNPLKLERREVDLLVHFTLHISQWIDHFDPYKHFSCLVPRLALHNVGLMNAILALSARNHAVSFISSTDQVAQAKDEALKYYHESLHYLRIAMQYTSYQTSQELLATTLIISAFEMLDGSPQDWQRHLQGVFWIQRSQIIHGDSSGLQGAVWWAWLAQDIWAAYRSKRKVFTFWKPTKRFRELNPTQLATRAIFLLGQVINFVCGGEECNNDIAAAITTKLAQTKALEKMLDEWESLLTIEFTPLPSYDNESSPVFAMIMIHPPIFASAMQLYHTCRLLICLHRPSLGGLQEREKRQTQFSEHISIICGIAMSLTDYGSSVISSICLFIGT